MDSLDCERPVVCPVLTNFLLDFHEVLGGTLLLLLILLPAIVLILFLVAFWRMGTGLLMTAEALGHARGLTTVATSLKKLAESAAPQFEDQGQAEALKAQAAAGQELAAATKAQAAAATDLNEQVKLAVQWYVHSLQQPENGKPAKK